MSNNSSTSTAARSGGLGFAGLLGLLFIGLKLGGVITWSWWLVLLPLYAGLLLFASILLVAVVILGIVAVVEDRAKRKRRASRNFKITVNNPAANDTNVARRNQEILRRIERLR